MSADRGHNVVKCQFSQLDPQIQCDTQSKSQQAILWLLANRLFQEREDPEGPEDRGLISSKFKTFIKL